jgi:hypothetical protein
MDAAQIAAVMEFLKTLPKSEQRVLAYEASGGHSCSQSTTSYNCCGQDRCQACHVAHLHSAHGKEKVHAFEKFARAQTLTWQVREYKTPLKTKEIKKLKIKKVQSPSLPKDVDIDVSKLSDADTVRLMAFLKSKLNV